MSKFADRVIPRFVYLGAVRARFTAKTLTRHTEGDPRVGTHWWWEKKILPVMVLRI